MYLEQLQQLQHLEHLQRCPRASRGVKSALGWLADPSAQIQRVSAREIFSPGKAREAKRTSRTRATSNEARRKNILALREAQNEAISALLLLEVLQEYIFVVAP
jgi:hypothetical protein